MTGIKSSIMITDGIKVVHKPLSLERRILYQVGSHIQAFDWEIDLEIYFAAAEHRVALMRESLEVDDKELWGLVDFHLLECRHMVFALRAIPFVVACESFFLAKARKTIIKVNIIAILHPLWYSILLFLPTRGSWCIQVYLVELRILELFQVNSGACFPVDR
jgi:hypothetical protein